MVDPRTGSFTPKVANVAAVVDAMSSEFQLRNDVTRALR
jgi:hypothetical protein